ncbi:IS66 family transposase [Photobacterium damselae subsp. damselae]|uniref:IS66 family transposase n=1 Tax=Photobacterium damselae TaxID=38293 RepID=UPI0010FF42CC|nr:IS66 family transposase [Photobacterium damselae]TLS78181.1 IS66 family transposase [Photobacterium damselae subsp. damselae]TLS84546.1 IS66 family transposase [Photobacterium damselae subsp. damselae]
MKKTPNINPESQDVTELQAMVRALLASQKQSESQWQQERQSLLEQLKLAFDRQFAKRSEALKPYNASQGDLFNEVEYEAAKEEEVESTITTTTTKKRGKRKPLPKTLPHEVIELDIDAHEKQCACCRHTLHKIGEDRSEKLEFTPAVLKVLEYVRPKYACRQCEKTQDSSCIVQKPAPQSIIPKSFATESLLTNIILGKYQYAMPLYRQESLFTQSGIELSRTTMARWILQVSEKLTPLYAALKEHLLRQVVVQADETPLNVIKEEKQCYMWLYCSGTDSPDAALPNVKNIVLYDYQNSRARACPIAFLGGYSGYLQTDGYSAYDGLHQVTNVGCLAHARRKFMDAKKLQGKGKSGKADNALSKIQKLYGIESRLKGASAEQRKAERQKYAKPILDELYEWMTTQQVIASSALGKAIKYTLGQWPKLIRYIEDGHLSIDNNRAERAIKPLVIGRKNWLFSNTPRGADASAMLYSIVETAKANGLILYDYLVKCMKELAKPEPDINALLPWNFKH